MKQLSVWLIVCISSLILACGGNPEQEGDAAFQQQKYNQALSFYLQVKKSQPSNPTINEKIALSYMQKGRQLFERTHNIDAFAGNFEKGENFIPQTETSTMFNKGYSEALLQLATAYHNSKPDNEIQREQYFTRTLDLLDLSLSYDETNAAAEQLLADIKTQNFTQTYEKGMDFYQKARKEKNPDLYLTAERYLKRAVYFDPENADALKNLKNVRVKTQSILDMDSPLPMAVADSKYFEGHLLLALTVLNADGQSLEFDPQKLTLVDDEGNTIAADMEFSAKFDDGLIKVAAISPRKQLDGTIAFAVAKKQKLVALSYQLSDKVTVKKYLP